MRKFFLLIPALVLSLFTNAAVININNTTPNALQAALNSAATGDIIEMAAGTYEESGNYLAFTGKELIVRAAEGAEVIIKTVCPVRLKEGAKAEFVNVKFDCSTIGSYDYVIVAADDTDNKRVVLTGCEFYGWTKEKAMIEATSSRRLAAITINNCYFHDCMKSVVFVENTGSIDLSITNSTFANITTSTNFSAGVIDSRATSGSFLVDHCTFYDVEAMNTDYAAIGKLGLASGAVVSNCIFALSTPGASTNRTIRDVVAANNCLVYNYSTDGGYGMQSDVTKTNCFIADPLFTDAANGDFSYAGNWVTMSFSPARGAATDGSDLGDPRWYSAEILPSTDFSTAYDLVGAKALLNGNIELNESNHIKYKGSQVAGTAKWKLHISKACALGAVADREAGNTSGCTLTLTVYDTDGNEVSTITAARSDNDNDINFPGCLYIPEEGDYTIILTNSVEWSGAILEKITLSYMGGAVQSMPGTTDIDEAWFVGGTRADGKITFTSGHVDEGWAKWNVSFASAANFQVYLIINSGNGKKFTVALQDANGDDVVTPLYKNGGEQGSNISLEMGTMEVPAGNYILKVSNAEAWSDAEILGVQFAYAGGAAIELSKTTPAELLANADAILSDDWTIEGGKITHPESKATTGWAKWNVDCVNDGNYNVTVNISSDNGHLVRVEVFEDEALAPVYTLDETSSTEWSTGDLAIDLGNIILDSREYVVKVSNTLSSSHVQFASIVITYKNGARASLPAVCDFEDVILSEKAHITAGELWFNTIGDSNPVGQWAKWNVKVAEAGTFLFTMNVNAPSGQSYKISILDGETEIDAFESGSLGTGDKTVKHYFNLTAGNYTVKLENTYAWSQGHIVSLAVTQPSLLVLDEAAETNTVIVDNYLNGTHDIQIIRTIVADMYNTICLPFDVNSTQLKAIFGSDVELKQLSSAELNGDELDLIFEDATSIYRGTPYLIMTSSNVVNPVFAEVEIKAEEGAATSGTNADFIGSFIAGQVPAGEDNLFLGPNNLLYFWEEPTPIKGTRAYFHIKGVPHPSQSIKHAKIITNDQVVTSIDFTKGENNKVMKAIENGQLIIIRNGERFTVQGQRIQ